MAKKKHKLLRKVGYQFEYLALRVASAILGRLPLRSHGPIAGVIGGLFYRLIPFRKDLIVSNISHAFPDMSAGERKNLIQRVYRRGVETALEITWMRHTTPQRLMEVIEPDMEAVTANEEVLRNRGHAVLATAHLGNWEMLLAWLNLKYGGVAAVYKPMHNPLTDKFALELRERFGASCFSTRSKQPRELVEHIKNGGHLGMLSDQDGGKRGIFVPFFGRPASTASGLATTCIRNNMPLVFGYCLRTGPTTFKLRTYPYIQPDPAADRQEEERRLLTQYAAWCEQAVREAPEQYFWWHNRWKSRPRPPKKQS